MPIHYYTWTTLLADESISFRVLESSEEDARQQLLHKIEKFQESREKYEHFDRKLYVNTQNKSLLEKKSLDAYAVNDDKSPSGETSLSGKSPSGETSLSSKSPSGETPLSSKSPSGETSLSCKSQIKSLEHAIQMINDANRRVQYEKQWFIGSLGIDTCGMKENISPFSVHLDAIVRTETGEEITLRQFLLTSPTVTSVKNVDIFHNF